MSIIAVIDLITNLAQFVNCARETGLCYIKYRRCKYHEEVPLFTGPGIDLGGFSAGVLHAARRYAIANFIVDADSPRNAHGIPGERRPEAVRYRSHHPRPRCFRGDDLPPVY